MIDATVAIGITAAATAGAVRVIIDELEYSGTFADGEVIVIYTEYGSITKDSVNDFSNFSGEFWSLYPGSNSVIYEDDETSRSVNITIEHKDNHG